MRKTAFRAVAVLALLSATSVQAAQASKPCMTRDEVHGMVAYFSPSLLQSAMDKCAPQLGQEAYLASRGPAYVAQLREGQASSWPAASKAFAKLGGGKDAEGIALFASLPEEAVRPMVEAIIAQKLAPEIKPRMCSDIDRILATIEPLPARNLIDFVTEIIVLAGKEDKDINVCLAG